MLLQITSPEMEDMPITSFTTDRHTQIRAFMKKEYSFISHQFDG